MRYGFFIITNLVIISRPLPGPIASLSLPILQLALPGPPVPSASLSLQSPASGLRMFLAAVLLTAITASTHDE